MLCPHDCKPCIDDLCHGGGCMAMQGYPMLDVCPDCKGTIDDGELDMTTCKCHDDPKLADMEDEIAEECYYRRLEEG